ncbi:MAG: D-aminoacyl-tRNA deacylase [Archaeoglobaceae archaeon]|nr:D-aminoacyl-tRNA deacylase [Archaeoglobaceae archaeon]MDW8128810.1 D-aminoacyl-tRNA deacylase [Archaeoglobaceae archaeon]
MKLVVCSIKDPASLNIMSHLLTMDTFEKKRIGNYVFHLGNHFAVVEVDEKLIYADNIDERLSKVFEFEEILFASRHSSKDGRKIFTAHVSGNIGENRYGGKPRSLAKPSPITIKNYVLALKERMRKKPEFEFTLEATHHGPSELSKPSAFYEIGSTEEEWEDGLAGEIVAEAIFEAIKDQRRDWKVAIGIGGTHYVPRQTEIILETIFTFAHNFAKYSFADLTPEMLQKAIEISEAKYLIYDDKSTTSQIKSLFNEIKGVEILKAKEAKKFKLE